MAAQGVPITETFKPLLKDRPINLFGRRYQNRIIVVTKESNGI
jgi:hypothetical protein